MSAEILFCHGLESSPHGRKVHALRDAGFDVTAPDFRGQNLAARVETLLEILDRKEPPSLLLGSSYGGLTALCAAILRAEAGGALPPAGLLLCAPALARAEPPADRLDLRAPAPTIILHGTRDEVVPIELSRQLAAQDPQVELVEVDDAHALAHSLDRLLDLVHNALAGDRRN